MSEHTEQASVRVITDGGDLVSVTDHGDDQHAASHVSAGRTESADDRNFVEAEQIVTGDAAGYEDAEHDHIERTLPMDGGIAHVLHAADGDRVELTITLEKSTLGITLSPDEAARIGDALARPEGFTVDDYLTMRDQLNGNASTPA